MPSPLDTLDPAALLELQQDYTAFIEAGGKPNQFAAYLKAALTGQTPGILRLKSRLRIDEIRAAGEEARTKAGITQQALTSKLESAERMAAQKGTTAITLTRVRGEVAEQAAQAKGDVGIRILEAKEAIRVNALKSEIAGLNEMLQQGKGFVQQGAGSASASIESLAKGMEARGDIGKSYAEALRAYAQEHGRIKVRTGLGIAENKAREFGVTLGDITADLEAAVSTGKNMMPVIDDKIRVAFDDQQRSKGIKTATEEIIAGTKSWLDPHGDPEVAGKLATKLADLAPELRTKAVEQARTKGKAVRGGIAGGIAVPVLAYLGSQIFGGSNKKTQPGVSPEMQIALAQQLAQAQQGETMQQGRELRNVATLLGIIKQLRDMQGFVGSQTSLPAVI